MRNPLGWIAIPIGLLFVGIQATAIDLPKRKSGLWDMKISRANHPAQAMQMCIDQKTDNMALQMVETVGKQACSKQDVRREGDKIVGDSVCQIGETTATSHSVFTGAFDQSYRGEIRSKFDPPLMGKRENLTLIEGRWTGPCKADQKPGDMIMPNGMKINIRQMSGHQ